MSNYMFAPGASKEERKLVRKEFDRQHVEAIKKIVCDYFNIDPEDIRAHKKKDKYAIPRHLFVYLIYKYFISSKATIALYMDRDHTTIIHSIKAAQCLIDTREDVRNNIYQLEQKIASITDWFLTY